MKNVILVVEKAFFSFAPEENRRFTRSTEKQLGQLERRILRKQYKNKKKFLLNFQKRGVFRMKNVILVVDDDKTNLQAQLSC